MNIKERLNHKITHFLGFLGGGAGQSTARIASSNTFLRPFCVNAEHSKYLTALISFAICKLWVYDMGAMFFWRSFSIVSGSSRKSSFVPTKIIGFSGAWWLISGYHYNARWLLNTTDHDSCLCLLIPINFTFVLTFSKEGGLTSEKQHKNTSVWG